MIETIPEDLMQAARKIGENLRFELAEIQFREAAALWGKPGVIEAMTASLSSVLMAERTRQEERVRVLEEALRDANCPRPCNGHPDDFTVGECADALECGCNLGVPFRAALHGGGDA